MDEKEKRLLLRMKTATEVRRSIQRVANMVINGDIEPKQANSVIMAGNTILTSLRVDEQQKKLEELETAVNKLLENRQN